MIIFAAVLFNLCAQTALQLNIHALRQARATQSVVNMLIMQIAHNQLLSKTAGKAQRAGIYTLARIAKSTAISGAALPVEK